MSLTAVELHLVGGFLGSGKTTAIAAAADELVRRGRTVGIVTNDQGQILVLELMVGALREEQIPLGHLKCAIKGAGGLTKVSFTAFASSAWRAHVPQLAGTTAALVLNVRAETAAPRLRALVQASIQKVGSDQHAVCMESGVAAFHPGFPKPTHRLA